MSDVGPADQQPEAESRSHRWTLSDRGGRVLSACTAALLLLVIAAGGWLLTREDAGEAAVAVEAADSIGLDPFTTAGIMATGAAPSGGAGLFGGSGDNGVCVPDALVAFLEAHPDKAAAWVAALNADPTLRWSGGDRLETGDIAAYVAELVPAVLTRDARVTNHGFKNGRATPRESVLARGTAVLADDRGAPRVRCFCGNPLHPQDAEGATAAHAAPVAAASPVATPAATPAPEGDHDGDGPEPTDSDCPDVGPVPSGADSVTTALVDFTGNGSADILRVYRTGGVWHARAEVGGVGIADVVLVGPGPAMTAVGGATVNNDPVEEAWVKVGSGASTDLLGLLVLEGCDLERVHLNGAPAELPVGSSTSDAHGVACFGFDTGIEVFTTTSNDGITYTGTSSLYTIDLTTSPPSLLLGASANQSETTSSSSFPQLNTFNCDSLSTIP